MYVCVSPLSLSSPHIQLGVMDMVHLLSKFQDRAQDPTTQISSTHRTSLHALTAGILYLISKVTTTQALSDHVQEVIERRREFSPMLLPDGLFREIGEGGGEGEGVDGAAGRGDHPGRVGEELLFQLRERGFVRASPEPALDTRRGDVCNCLAQLRVASVCVCVCVCVQLCCCARVPLRPMTSYHMPLSHWTTDLTLR